MFKMSAFSVDGDKTLWQLVDVMDSGLVGYTRCCMIDQMA